MTTVDIEFLIIGAEGNIRVSATALRGVSVGAEATAAEARPVVPSGNPYRLTTARITALGGSVYVAAGPNPTVTPLNGVRVDPGQAALVAVAGPGDKLSFMQAPSYPLPVELSANPTIDIGDVQVKEGGAIGTVASNPPANTLLDRVRATNVALDEVIAGIDLLRLFRPVDGASDTFTDSEAAVVGPLAAGRVRVKVTGGLAYLQIAANPEPTDGMMEFSDGDFDYLEVNDGDSVAVIGATGESGKLQVSTETVIPEEEA